MTAFTDDQIAALTAPLSAEHVKEREQAGRKLSYIEGWIAIKEANRIFGFDAWDRETVECRCVVERETKIGRPPNQRDGWRVAYVAKVRVTVRPNRSAVMLSPGTQSPPRLLIVREGTGYGSGIDQDLGAAHESAIKEAETDAMKRGLMTFGNPFGLALYDKTQSEVEPVQRGAQKPVQARSPAAATLPTTGLASPQARTSGQLLPPNPEEPPEVGEARKAASAHFWTRADYSIDPNVIQGGMTRWDAEFLALARAAPTLDAFVKLKEDNRSAGFFDAWQNSVQRAVALHFRAECAAIEKRLNKPVAA